MKKLITKMTRKTKNRIFAIPSRAGDATESEKSRDKRDNQEYPCVVKICFTTSALLISTSRAKREVS